MVIEVCVILFTLYVWNAMCCLCCTATVLFLLVMLVWNKIRFYTTLVVPFVGWRLLSTSNNLVALTIEPVGRQLLLISTLAHYCINYLMCSLVPNFFPCFLTFVPVKDRSLLNFLNFKYLLILATQNYYMCALWLYYEKKVFCR